MQLVQKNELECKTLISNLAGELLHTTVAKKYKDTLHPLSIVCSSLRSSQKYRDLKLKIRLHLV